MKKVVDYLMKIEKQQRLEQNEVLSTARNLHVEVVNDNYSGRINRIWISRKFIQQELLKSLGVSCIEVEILKNSKEFTTKNLENYPESKLAHLTEDGIVKVGAYVRGGDIIVAKQIKTNKGWPLSYVPWRRKWQPAPVFLPGEFHGLGKLGDYSSWGHREQTGLK